MRQNKRVPKHRLQVLIPTDVFQQLDQLAQANNRSLSGEVATAVQEYVRRHHSQITPPLSDHLR